jgi:glyoxylase-like metal-dependent hydrolase (beta-lactamase superfamily II)
MSLTQSAFTVATSRGSSVAVDLGSEMPTEMIQGLGTLAGVVISHKHPDHLRLIDAPKYGPADVVEELRRGTLGVVVLSIGESGTLEVSRLRPFDQTTVQTSRRAYRQSGPAA